MRIVQQVSLGLAQAHELGIVDRDISPDNILMVPAPAGPTSPKCSTLGSRKNMGPGGGKITQTMKLVGKAEYVAPEQIAGPSGDDDVTPIDVERTSTRWG